MKISKKLQSALDKVGLKTPKTSEDADRMAGLFDLILRNSNHLTMIEEELFAAACRELDKLAAKLVVAEYEALYEAH